MRYLADVKGGLHAQYAGTLGTIGNLTTSLINDHLTNRAAQALDSKGTYPTRKLLEVLLGAAPGANAQYVWPEIQASPELGGVRQVNNVNLINRASTAADVTDLKNALTTFSGLKNTQSPVYNGDRNPLGTR